MDWQAARQDRLDRFDHVSRLVALGVGAFVVVAVAVLGTICILNKQPVAGTIFAGVDLVALATVFVNAFKKGS